MGVIRYAANGTTILDGDTNGSEYVLIRDANGDPLGTETTPFPVMTGIPPHPAAGGYYSVAGGLTSAISASLAANTSLLTMRFDTSSARTAYIDRFRINILISTVGTSALVPGWIALQRFTAATPTGGTARTVNKQNESLATTSDMTDIRDSSGALTTTGVTFGTILAGTHVPIVISGATSYYEWIYEPPYPVVMAPGDGIAFRAQSAFPATQTWLFDYNVYWHED